MKALALLSGGLDSTLAVKVMLDQGINVIAVNFTSPFCQCNRRTAGHAGGGCLNLARTICEKFHIELKIVPLREEYLAMVTSPRHGYGRNLNPCLDCRILMLKKAREVMEKTGAAFIITGEVLGQRPKSQYRQALALIERESGLAGLIVRPLSAQLLLPSIPEQRGWIDRARLLAISGRSRKPQLQMVADHHIEDYACPAGGCLLTDRGFADRMRDLMSHGGVTMVEVPLLKTGRHFRLGPETKLVVGRDEHENNLLEQSAHESDLVFTPLEVPGPTALGRGVYTEATVTLAAAITAKHCDGSASQAVRIECRGPLPFLPRTITANRITDAALEPYRINKSHTNHHPDA